MNAGRGLEPITLPRHAYERMIAVLHECHEALWSQSAKDKIQAAIAFAEQLRTEEPIDPREDERLQEAPPWMEER